MVIIRSIKTRMDQEADILEDKNQKRAAHNLQQELHPTHEPRKISPNTMADAPSNERHKHPVP